MTDILDSMYTHNAIEHIIYIRKSMFTNFLPCLQSTNPISEAYLLTCAVSDLCYMICMCTLFSFDPGIQK